MSTCDKDHVLDLPKATFDAVPASQAGVWRHKCAGCAYDLGRKTTGDVEARLRQRVRDLEAEVARLKGGK